MKWKPIPKCHGWGALALADLLVSAVLTVPADCSVLNHLLHGCLCPGGFLGLEPWAGKSAKPPSCAVGRQEKLPSAQVHTQVVLLTKSEIHRALPEDDGLLSVLGKCFPAGLSPPAPSLLGPK